MDREKQGGTVERNRISLTSVHVLWWRKLLLNWPWTESTNGFSTKPSVFHRSRRTWRCIPCKQNEEILCWKKRNIHADEDSVSGYVLAVLCIVGCLYGHLNKNWYTLTAYRAIELYLRDADSCMGERTRNFTLFTIPKVRNSKLDQCIGLSIIIWSGSYTSWGYLRGKNRPTNCFVWYVTMLLQLRSLFRIEWDEGSCFCNDSFSVNEKRRVERWWMWKGPWPISKPQAGYRDSPLLDMELLLPPEVT